MECPCRYCTDRWVKEVDGKIQNCHSACSKYQEWSDWHAEVTGRVRKAKEYDNLSRTPRRNGR